MWWQIKVWLQYLNKKDLPQIETAINLLENGQKFIVKIAWKNQMNEFDFTILAKEDKELKHKSSLEINADGGMYLEKFILPCIIWWRICSARSGKTFA